MYGYVIDAPPVRILLFKEENDDGKQITNLTDIPDEYFKKPKYGGICLEIVIRTAPPPSEIGSHNNSRSTAMNIRDDYSLEMAWISGLFSNMSFFPNTTLRTDIPIPTLTLSPSDLIDESGLGLDHYASQHRLIQFTNDLSRQGKVCRFQTSPRAIKSLRAISVTGCKREVLKS